MKDKLFGVLQRVGRSFMLPIAILPVAGLFLGIGGSFTNETMLQTYGLSGIMGPGSFVYSILTVMSQAGDIVFANLPILFAMGVAIGMAKREKEVAALSAAIAFFIMHASIGAMIRLHGGEEALLAGAAADVLGITSLQMGVFGGIIVGLGVAALHNRFYKIELPQVLSFFGGTRFVPIVSSVTYLIVGIIMFYLWPPVQRGIYLVGDVVLNSGYAGTWIYGLMERALIPFGLHHVFYLPFWQTAVGGTAMVNGQLIEGAQNIFFAELASPGIERFSVSATRFMAGKFPLMIFGLPGAAFAMYRQARPEKRKQVGGLLLSAALTSMVTGITEPLEFTFLFVAPLLYVIHCILAGAAYMLMHLFQVGVGMTFSGGLIDLCLFGILQGNDKTNWIYVVFVGVAYFFVYYFLFGFLIRRFDYKTPGREEGDADAKLYTRADVEAEKAGGRAGSKSGLSGGEAADQISPLIVKGLGGADNIRDVDCCATRLRTTVKDAARVDEAALNASGARGIIKKGNGVQVIYGPRVTVIKSNLEDFLASPAAEKIMGELPTDVSGTEDGDAKTVVPEVAALETAAPMTGEAMSLEKVADGVFSERMLGDGAAIEPEDGMVYAPFDGVVDMVFETKHAIGLHSDSGIELLIHMGIDTVRLEGKYFDVKVKDGDLVKQGDLLCVMDLEGIRQEGYRTVTPVIVTNTEQYAGIRLEKEGRVRAGERFLISDIS
ncbi:MAG: PTS transporter subunit EIIC [Lachnospiraceae bacterium]|nr:PTS transporter subunit EIIC [Lachnospiraceae bacterium]